MMIQIRIATIGLPRNISRWNNAKSALLELQIPCNLKAHHCENPLFSENEDLRTDDATIEITMALGVDAHAYREMFETNGDIDAIETALQCHVYKGWAITDEFDVARVWPEAAFCVVDPDDEILLKINSDNKPTIAQAIAKKYGLKVFLEYESWFRQKWHRRFVDKYVGYFMRHMTLGECGSSLAHLRLIERQVHDQIPIHIIFEDDAHPRPDLLVILQPFFEKLQDIDWDILLLDSVKYDFLDEPQSQIPGLNFASHRKVTDAYCTSLRGATKIANAGYRDALFPFDDYLPALYSIHPRKDLYLLRCVQAASGLVALTFPDDMPLTTRSEDAAVSSNNLSPCLIGDHGVTVTSNVIERI